MSCSECRGYRLNGPCPCCYVEFPFPEEEAGNLLFRIEAGEFDHIDEISDEIITISSKLFSHEADCDTCQEQIEEFLKQNSKTYREKNNE